MAMIKLLHTQDQARVQGTPVAADAVASTQATVPTDAPSDVLGALDDLLAGANPKAAQSPIPTEATEPETTVLLSPVAEPAQAQPVAAAAATVQVPKARPPGFLKQAALKNEVKKDTHRAALDYLNILKSLAPVFKAAFIYPGHDAAPDQIGAAVRKMSQVSVGLADYIATHGDHLEVDGAWARKTLHDFTSDLVANHWISSVLGKGGAVPGHSPDISIDYFIPAIRAVMELPTDLPAAQNKINLSLGGAVQISLLKAMTPVALEAEKFADIVNAAGYASPVRTPRGRDILAACGQLKSETEKLRARARLMLESGIGAEGVYALGDADA